MDSLLVELLVTVFLGPLGVHKFLNKEVGLGIVYFFTGGLFFIGWFVDVVKVVIKMINGETRNNQPQSSNDFNQKRPQIYVFEDRHRPGWLKVGYTTRQNAEDRVREQFNTILQLDEDPYILHLVEDAVDKYGQVFTDRDVHKVLTDKGIFKKGEFFLTDIDTVKSAIMSVKKKKYL